MALRIASGGHACSPLSISDAYAEVPNTKAAEAKLDNNDVERIGHLMSLDRLWLAGRRVSTECLPQLERKPAPDWLKLPEKKTCGIAIGRLKLKTDDPTPG